VAAIALPPKKAEPGAEMGYREMAGRILGGVEVRVALEDGSIAPNDGHTVGEFEISGPFITGSYHNVPADPEKFTGDEVYFQGHAAPGIYARAFLEGRLTADQLDHFRQEVQPGRGLSSYPHPRLMPDFWEFPTVSMGLGPICAIYQARFMRYLEDRGLKFRLAAQTESLIGGDAGRVTGARFKDGTEVPADLVVMAVGIRPNTDLAESMGLHCSRGVVVSDTLQTVTDPRIYAVGECANHRGTAYGLVAPLFEQGHAAALPSPKQNDVPTATRAVTRMSSARKITP